MCPVQLHSDYLESLVSISETLFSYKDPEQLFQRILSISMDTLKAERGFISYLDDNRSDFKLKTFSSRDGTLSDLAEISQGVVQKVSQTGEPLLSKDAKSDPRFSSRQSVILQGIRSVACVPLKRSGQVMGVIYMDSRGEQRLFTWDTINYLTLMASFAALAIENAIDFDNLQSAKVRLEQEVQRSCGFPGIIGNSPKMKQVYDSMIRIMNTDLPVLITGESGTGKELVARALHYSSHRGDKPFMALFCGNLSPELLESELFGHIKGAFTGAVYNKTGLVKEAEGGTLLLDEITELPGIIQTKLLRFLQEGDYRPVGGNTTYKADVRILAISNKDMKVEVESKRFRADLYWRLNVLTLHLPPLRERRDDIPLLISHFIKRYGMNANKPNISIGREALKMLIEYHWPGNVRELENTIARAVVFCSGNEISPDSLMIGDEVSVEADLRLQADSSLKSAVKRHIVKVLKQCDGNRSEAVRRLGISRRYLYNIIAELKEQGLEV